METSYIYNVFFYYKNYYSILICFYKNLAANTLKICYYYLCFVNDKEFKFLFNMNVLFIKLAKNNECFDFLKSYFYVFALFIK